jgi:glycosyltransferase involved in cell wall biosynthesis
MSQVIENTELLPSSANAADQTAANDNPIRVLHIITRMIVGGAQENTLLSVEGLDAMTEYDVDFISGIDTGREGELLTRARETTNLIIVPELGRAINPFSDIVAFWKLYRLTKKGRYHIVHTHSSKAGVLGRIAAYFAGTPLIVHTLHSLVFHDYQPWIVNRTWRIIKKICAPMTDYFISVSSVIVDKAIAAKVDKPEKFTTIYSGMELDWFLNANFDAAKIREEFGIPLDAPVVGKIARLFPLKGHDELMDAAPEIVRRVPNVRFFLIGDGILYEHLQERAKGYGILENFVFAGLIDRERIPEMISAMDMVVHTSLREGLARVLPQSLAMGKPCVSFNIDGAPEVVINDKTGYLVEPYDSVGLADGISRILENPELMKRMGEEGRKLVDPPFRKETMVQEISNVYQMLLKKYPERIAKFNKKFAKTA